MRKSKTFQIDIPNPCDEKWSDMTPTKGGRHCDRCEKTIVDCRDKTDREIAHLYKQSNGKMCGRFGIDQLKRDITLIPKSPSRHMSKAAAVLLSGMLSAGTAAAQGEVTIQRTEQRINENENKNEKVGISDTRTISGRVTDENGEGLPFANVYIKEACTGTTTDIDGNYSLEIRENAEILVVSYTGYHDTEVALTKEQNTDVNIVMQGGEICFVGIVVVSDYSYVQDAPRGRTFPQLIRDWIGNIKYKRANKKAKSQPEITTTQVAHTLEAESEATEIRPTQIITNKLITNVFPNPFDDKIHVTLQSEAVEPLRLVVYDSMSREIYSQKINVLMGTNEFDLDLKGKQIENGSYFLSVFRGEEVIQTEILMRVE